MADLNADSGEHASFVTQPYWVNAKHIWLSLLLRAMIPLRLALPYLLLIEAFQYKLNRLELCRQCQNFEAGELASY